MPLANIKTHIPDVCVHAPQASCPTGDDVRRSSPLRYQFNPIKICDVDEDSDDDIPANPVQLPHHQESLIPVIPGSLWIRDTEQDPSVLQHPDSAWLRAHQGVVQRKVMLQNLSKSPQYNGCFGWVDISKLESADSCHPALLAVQLIEPDRLVQVNSAHVFLVNPAGRPGKPHDSLFTVCIKLHTPRGPVPVRALVDTGCELPGLLNKRLVSALDLPLEQASRTVRTATGEVVTGVQQVSVQTHFGRGFTRRLSYGVLDLPGFDAILGVGFLRQCAPYQLRCDGHGKRSVLLTSPSSHRLVVMEGETVGALEMQATQLKAVMLPKEVHSPLALEMLWTVPSSEDYANAVAAFSVLLDSDSNQPVVRWAEEHERPPPSSPEQYWDDKLTLN